MIAVDGIHKIFTQNIGFIVTRLTHDDKRILFPGRTLSGVPSQLRGRSL